MSKPKLPHFPLFFGDLLAATPRPKWKGQHRSLYVLLLAHQWFYGPIPSDPESIADMCDYPLDEFKRLWQVVGKKFVPTEGADGGLINLRCEEHREKAAKISKKRRVAGKKGGETTKSRSQQNKQQTGQQVLQQSYEQSDQQTGRQSLEQTEQHGAAPFARPSIPSHPNPSYSNPVARSAREEKPFPLPESDRDQESESHDRWQRCQQLYPPYHGRKHWIMAESAARQLVARDRATWDVIEDRTRRYGEFCKMTGRPTMRPENFFATVDDPPCLQSWDLPEPVAGVGSSTTRGDAVIDEFFKERAASGEES